VQVWVLGAILKLGGRVLGNRAGRSDRTACDTPVYALTPARKLVLALWLLGVAASATFPPWRYLDVEHGHLLGPAPRHFILAAPLREAWESHWAPVQDTVDWRRLPLEWIATTAAAAAALLTTGAFGRKSIGA
jgi:hypothetical protein